MVKEIDSGAVSQGDQGDPLELLIGATQAFAASLDPTRTMQRTTAHMMHLLRAEAASLFLLEGGEVVCRACAGPIDITGLRLGAEQGIVGKTVRERHCYRVADVHRDPDFLALVDRRTGFVTRSLLSAPLVTGGRCLGAMQLVNKRTSDGRFQTRDEGVVKALAAAAALAIRNARMAAELVEQERLRHELALAREIQRGLLPVHRDAQLAATGLSISAREMSGDFYDYFRLPDGRVFFDVADVAGKGIDAALLMAKTSSLLRCLAKSGLAPGELLARVNDELCETATRGKFVTAVAGWYDPGDHSVELANAGHQPPLLRTSKGEYRELAAAAAPLGVLPGIRFPEVRMDLAGDALYLYTDGLTEARDAQGRQQGVEGVRRCIEAAVGLPPRQRVAAVVGALTGIDPVRRDDATLLVVERVAAG